MTAPHSKCMGIVTDLANLAFDADLPGEMKATLTVPLATHLNFPAQTFSCPHGVPFYIWPDQDRIDALQAMNEAGGLR